MVFAVERGCKKQVYEVVVSGGSGGQGWAGVGRGEQASKVLMAGLVVLSW